MYGHTGHSSAFSTPQYSGTCGSAAAKRVLLEPVSEKQKNIYVETFIMK